MASSSASVSVSVSPSSSEVAAAAATMTDGPDGPVMSLIGKRLRALRKKYNRILQMEESLAQGKSLNKEQEDVLRSKPAVVVLIDEYEKLQQPLSAALHDELSRFSSASPQTPPKDDEVPSPALPTSADEPYKAVEDLVTLLYFGCLFAVKPQSEFTATLLTRTHERNCCLTYDYVTDDATDLLGERDLDAISALSSLLTLRPVYSGVSHKNALQGCLQHAKLWLQNADHPIHPGASMTYAGLREKLKKILASDYFTTTPEMKAPVDVAAAVGKVQISDCTTVPSPVTQAEGVPFSANYQQEDQDEQQDFCAVEVQLDHQSNHPVDEPPNTDESSVLNTADSALPSQGQQKFEVDGEDRRDGESKDQYYTRRSYQNQRGGNRGGGGGQGGWRGYANGRAGRVGGGGYQNGRSQYYEPGYYPRNSYNTRGRGGRSVGSGMYNNHGGGFYRGHVPATELRNSA